MSWRSMITTMAIGAIVIPAIGSASSADVGASPAAGASPAPRAAAHARAGRSLEHRVDVLSKALQLDARQRAELLTILDNQRAAVAGIWHNPGLLPAERTPATRAVEERTADQIRAILSDEQKKLFNPPKPHGTESPASNVADWMQRQARQNP
jgi:hypothetical protein